MYKQHLVNFQPEYGWMKTNEPNQPKKAKNIKELSHLHWQVTR